MSEQAEIDARARELLVSAAREAEDHFLDEQRDRSARDIFARIKRGMKGEALFETGLGKAFADRCNMVIVNACDVWLSTESTPEQIAKARAEAQAAVAAMNCFGSIIDDGKEAEQQLRQLDYEIGASE